MIEPAPTHQPKTATDLDEIIAIRADLISLTIRLERMLEANGRPVRSAVVTRQARRHLTKRQR